MYHTEDVQLALIGGGKDQKFIDDVMARAENVKDDDGCVEQKDLEYVLGCPQLVRWFQQIWDREPDAYVPFEELAIKAPEPRRNFRRSPRRVTAGRPCQLLYIRMSS